MKVIEIFGLNKSFFKDGQEIKVLQDISLSVEKNEFVSVVGPSGCGKSTLLRTIAGLIESESEKINIVGDTSYLQQKTLLMPWRNVYENASLPLEIETGKRIQDDKHVLNLISEFGLKGFEEHMPGELSGGMAKRVTILRSYLEDRDILLLDEPFSSLDAISRKQMQQWLLDVWREHKKTVVFVTHDIDEALYLSDKVYILSQRPATVTEELNPGFERPRAYDIVYSPDFINMKKNVEKLLLSGS